MPAEPYVAVIFTSQRTNEDDAGYLAMGRRMEQLARDQPGYRGIESVRDDTGAGITVSYWASPDAAAAWKRESEHLAAQSTGRERWYDSYSVRIASVEREYSFARPIFHLAMPDDWARAQPTGAYAVSTRGLTVARQGFMHCSFLHQMRGVVDRFYDDVDEVVVLHLDRAAVADDLIIEPAADGVEELFPHLYRELAIAEVTTTTPWRRGVDGWGEPPIDV